MRQYFYICKSFGTSIKFDFQIQVQDKQINTNRVLITNQIYMKILKQEKL
jgi:predicted oxidoreductase